MIKSFDSEPGKAVRCWYTELYTTAILGETHKLFQTLTVDINSLAHFMDNKETKNVHQIPSNIARHKLNCDLSSQTFRQKQ